MAEACAWLGAQQEQAGMKLAMLVGHWDVKGLGATKEMAGCALFSHLLLVFDSAASHGRCC